MELYRQLEDLGNCNSLYITKLDCLPCNIDCSKAEERVEQAKTTLNNRRKQISTERTEYPWLLFFSIPKILQLYKLLPACDNNPEQLDKIVCEISYICKNDEPTRQTLRQKVQVRVVIIIYLSLG